MSPGNTIDPKTSEGRRRTRRGVIIYLATLGSMMFQGLFLTAALRSPHKRQTVDPLGLRAVAHIFGRAVRSGSPRLLVRVAIH